MVGAKGARARSLREFKILAGDFERFRKLLSEPLKTSSILPSYSKIYLPKFLQSKNLDRSLHLRLKDQHLLVKDEIDLYSFRDSRLRGNDI